MALRPTDEMTARERRLLLAAVSSLSLTASYTQIAMAPLLSQVANEFGLSLGAAGLVVAVYAVPGIVVTALAGPFSDRFGRQRFLISGSALMTIFTLAGALSPSFEVLLMTRALAGLGASVIHPNVFATVADNIPYRERGRAVATVAGVNMMANVLGVPVAGIVGEATSWRASLALVGVLSLVALILSSRVRIPQIPVSATRVRELYRSIATKRSAVAALGTSLFGNLYWITWVTYVVVFFQRSFSVSQSVAATLALTVGLGALVGSQIGGHIGDRVGHRPVIAAALLTSAALLLFQTSLSLGLALTVLVNFMVSVVIGTRVASHQTLLSEQVPAARGTLLGLSAWTHFAATLVGVSVGGALIDGFGFWALGVFCAGMASVAAAVVLLFVREGPLEMEIQSA